MSGLPILHLTAVAPSKINQLTESGAEVKDKAPAEHLSDN